MAANPSTFQNPPTGDKSLAFETLKDAQGRYRTQSLFVEMKHEKYSAPYTLKKYDHRGAMSMYLKYMELGDPTEYTQAIALLGSWDHWKKLCAQSWFKEHLTTWRSELKVKMESDRFLEMDDVAKKQKGSPQGISATKWLAERYGEKPKRGRPSAEEKKGHLKQLTKEEELHAEDAERLGIT